MTEVILQKAIQNKDPNYLYYVDKEGNLCKKKKEGLKHVVNKTKRKVYQTVDLTIPRVVTQGEIFIKEKVVRKFGEGGMIHMPKALVGKKFKVILVPKEFTEDYVTVV